MYTSSQGLRAALHGGGKGSTVAAGLSPRAVGGMSGKN